jgi:hypothetical protein
MKMSNTNFLSLVLAFSILLTINVFAQTQITSTKVNKLEQVTLLNAFNQCSNKVSESFLRNDMKLASEETRKALEFVKKDALHATVEGEKLLNESRKGLKQLVQDLETGVSLSEEELKEVFVGARNAIIKNHHYVAIKRLHIQASNLTNY